MCSRLISARISSRSLASSAPIGSSIRSALGRRTSARPIATRCMSPPDSADGFLSSRWVICSVRATARTSWSTSAFDLRVALSGKAMFS